jgi:hypothetical protein
MADDTITPSDGLDEGLDVWTAAFPTDPQESAPKLTASPRSEPNATERSVPDVLRTRRRRS